MFCVLPTKKKKKEEEEEKSNTCWDIFSACSLLSVSAWNIVAAEMMSN